MITNQQQLSAVPGEAQVEAMGLEPTNLLTARPLGTARSGVVEEDSGRSCWSAGPSI